MVANLSTLDISYLILRANSKKPNNNGNGSRRRAKKILAILKRDGMRCVECGSGENLTIEHPGGRKFAKHENHQKYKIDKCITLCSDCHMKRNGWI
jgi:5-methylcytosine-specific restriction endonuclease McrA